MTVGRCVGGLHRTASVAVSWETTYTPLHQRRATQVSDSVPMRQRAISMNFGNAVQYLHEMSLAVQQLVDRKGGRLRASTLVAVL